MWICYKSRVANAQRWVSVTLSTLKCRKSICDEPCLLETIECPQCQRIQCQCRCLSALQLTWVWFDLIVIEFDLVLSSAWAVWRACVRTGGCGVGIWKGGLGVVAGELGVAQSSPGQSVGSGHLGSRHTAHCPSFQLFTQYIIISEIPSDMEVALCHKSICTAYTAFTAHTVLEQRGY